jgi:hypothetical protein
MPKAVDLDEFEVPTKKGAPCSVAVFVLTNDQAAKLAGALARSDITSAQIARVLKSWGLDISSNTVARHRRGDCACAFQTR